LRYADEARTPYERALVLDAYGRFLRLTEGELESGASMENEARSVVQAIHDTLHEGPHETEQAEQLRLAR